MMRSRGARVIRYAEIRRNPNKRPINCEQLEPPEINEIVAQVMSGGNKNRDQTLCSSQKQLTTALSALGQAITRMLDITHQNGSTELKESMLQFLGDSGRLLTHLFYTLTTLRRSLIFPLVNKEIKAVLEKTVPTGYLFGADLPEKIKDAKTLQAASSSIKATYAPSIKNPQPKKGGGTTFQGSRSLNRQRPVRRGETRRYKGQTPKSYATKESKAVAARQDQNRVGTSNFFGQFFRVIFFLTLHQLNGGDGYNAYYYKGET
jgi:hypothetical protein